MPPTPALLLLAITAGVLTLVVHWPRMRSGTAGMRLAAEVGITMLVLFALLVGLFVAVERML